MIHIEKRRLVTDQRGSFTVESSLVFPIVFIVTLLVIFASLFFYQKATLYYTAATLADRTAYQWNHSFHNDGLYWRMLSDRRAASPITNNDSLPTSGSLKKLQTAASSVTKGIRGSINYSNDLFDRRITVELENWFYAPIFTKSFLSNRILIEASSGVIDPVEYIRTIELIQTLGKDLVSKGISREQAKKALEEFLGIHSPGSFATHREAHAYLKLLVDGKELRLSTSYGVRVLDAFDRYSISNQAYLTFNESNLKLQLAKDAELLLKGDVVKGVVWHFFRRTNQTGRVGPSDAMRAEIESKGILVIIHD